jgi:hypothetical protein
MNEVFLGFNNKSSSAELVLFRRLDGEDKGL